LLYFYYLLAKDLEKIGLIMEAFVKDAVIEKPQKDIAIDRYQEYTKRNVEN